MKYTEKALSWPPTTPTGKFPCLPHQVKILQSLIRGTLSTLRLLSIKGDKAIQLSQDNSPHRNPPNGIQVTNQNPGPYTVSLRRHEAWVESSGRVRFGPALAYVPHMDMPWVLFPPALSLTLTETYFTGNSSDYVGQPVSSLQATGQSITFKVIPATQELSWKVNLERRPNSRSGILYAPTYTYSFNP
jgi:hypothetical protein